MTVIFRELRKLGRSMHLSHSSVPIEIYPTQPHITSCSSAVQCNGQSGCLGFVRVMTTSGGYKALHQGEHTVNMQCCTDTPR